MFQAVLSLLMILDNAVAAVISPAVVVVSVALAGSRASAVPIVPPTAAGMVEMASAGFLDGDLRGL